MQPQTSTQPVMNEAGPKLPAPSAQPRPAAAAPELLAPMKAEVSSGLAVAPAPPEGAAGQIPSAKKETIAETPAQAAAPKSTPKKKPAASGPKLPLALISVTIMVMLLLGTLAVIVYLTTRPS